MADDIFRRCGRSESERQNTAACKQVLNSESDLINSIVPPNSHIRVGTASSTGSLDRQ